MRKDSRFLKFIKETCRLAQQMTQRAIVPEPLRMSSLSEWAPIMVWAAVMFTFSTSAFSATNTSAIFTPILEWFFPAIPTFSLGVANLLIRKAAHFTEYAILCWLLVRGPLKRHPLVAVAFCVGYALLDEGHQVFVPGRTPSMHDVALDSSAAMFSGFLRTALGEIF
jgi:VanZ family protein